MASGRPLVGNDVVDLERALDPPPHPRFFERVCAPTERALLCQRAFDRRLAWTLFAAKEAAYKLVTKLRGSLAFVPAAFEVASDLRSIQHGGHTFELVVVERPAAVHAIVCTPSAHPLHALGWGDPDASSADVRRLVVAELGRRLRVEPARLAVVRDPDPRRWDGFAPPRLTLDDLPVALDVSLSHDGRYVAFAAASEGGAKALRLR